MYLPCFLIGFSEQVCNSNNNKNAFHDFLICATNLQTHEWTANADSPNRLLRFPLVFFYAPQSLSLLSASSFAASVGPPPPHLLFAIPCAFLSFSLCVPVFHCSGLLCLCMCICVFVCVYNCQSPITPLLIIILSTATLIGWYHSPTWREKRRGEEGGRAAYLLTCMCKHTYMHPHLYFIRVVLRLV